MVQYPLGFVILFNIPTFVVLTCVDITALWSHYYDSVYRLSYNDLFTLLQYITASGQHFRAHRSLMAFSGGPFSVPVISFCDAWCGTRCRIVWLEHGIMMHALSY